MVYTKPVRLDSGTDVLSLALARVAEEKEVNPGFPTKATGNLSGNRVQASIGESDTGVLSHCACNPGFT